MAENVLCLSVVPTINQVKRKRKRIKFSAINLDSTVNLTEFKKMRFIIGFMRIMFVQLLEVMMIFTPKSEDLKEGDFVVVKF